LGHHRLATGLALLGLTLTATAGTTVVSIVGEKFHVNGRPTYASRTGRKFPSRGG